MNIFIIARSIYIIRFQRTYDFLYLDCYPILRVRMKLTRRSNIGKSEAIFRVFTRKLKIEGITKHYELRIWYHLKLEVWTYHMSVSQPFLYDY